MKFLFTLAALLALTPAANAANASLSIYQRGRLVHAGEIATISLGSRSIRLVSERRSPSGNTYAYACLVSATVAAEDAFLTIQELAAHARDANRGIQCHVSDKATSDAPGSWVFEADQIEIR